MMSKHAPTPARLRPLLAATALASLLAACGGGGYLPSPVSVTDKRPLSAELTSRKAVAYSPYRTSRTEADLAREVITPANVRQDLLLIRGASESATVNTIMVIIKLAVLALFVAVAFTAFNSDHFHDFWAKGLDRKSVV